MPLEQGLLLAQGPTAHGATGQEPEATGQGATGSAAVPHWSSHHLAAHCHNCGTRRQDSPVMRTGPNGHGTLCNACGLYYKKTGKLRIIAKLENRGRGAKRRRELLQAVASEATPLPSLLDRPQAFSGTPFADALSDTILGGGLAIQGLPAPQDPPEQYPPRRAAASGGHSDSSPCRRHLAGAPIEQLLPLIRERGLELGSGAAAGTQVANGVSSFLSEGSRPGFPMGSGLAGQGRGVSIASPRGRPPAKKLRTTRKESSTAGNDKGCGPGLGSQPQFQPQGRLLSTATPLLQPPGPARRLSDLLGSNTAAAALGSSHSMHSALGSPGGLGGLGLAGSPSLLGSGNGEGHRDQAAVLLPPLLQGWQAAEAQRAEHVQCVMDWLAKHGPHAQREKAQQGVPSLPFSTHNTWGQGLASGQEVGRLDCAGSLGSLTSTGLELLVGALAGEQAAMDWDATLKLSQQQEQKQQQQQHPAGHWVNFFKPAQFLAAGQEPGMGLQVPHQAQQDRAKAEGKEAAASHDSAGSGFEVPVWGPVASGAKEEGEEYAGNVASGEGREQQAKQQPQQEGMTGQQEEQVEQGQHAELATALGKLGVQLAPAQLEHLVQGLRRLHPLQQAQAGGPAASSATAGIVPAYTAGAARVNAVQGHMPPPPSLPTALRVAAPIPHQQPHSFKRGHAEDLAVTQQVLALPRCIGNGALAGKGGRQHLGGDLPFILPALGQLLSPSGEGPQPGCLQAAVGSRTGGQAETGQVIMPAAPMAPAARTLARAPAMNQGMTLQEELLELCRLASIPMPPPPTHPATSDTAPTAAAAAAAIAAAGVTAARSPPLAAGHSSNLNLLLANPGLAVTQQAQRAQQVPPTAVGAPSPVPTSLELQIAAVLAVLNCRARGLLPCS